MSDTNTFKIKSGDTFPYFQFTLRDRNGPYPLSLAQSIRFHMRAKGSVTVLVDDDCTVTDATLGEAEYRWGPTDTTQTEGEYEAEVEVDFGGGLVATWPNEGHAPILITGEIE